MNKKAPGKAYRKGITLKQIINMFPDNETAEQWLIEQRWPAGISCPKCGSMNVKQVASILQCLFVVVRKLVVALGSVPKQVQSWKAQKSVIRIGYWLLSRS